MALGTDHLQTRRILRQLIAQRVTLYAVRQGHIPVQQVTIDSHHVSVEFDVRSTARHVGGDRHRSRLPCIGHDLGLFVMVPRIQQLMFDPLAGQHS